MNSDSTLNQKLLNPDPIEVLNDVATALQEDIGSGDLTAQLLPLNAQALAHVITREDCVICGTAWFDQCFRALDSSVEIHWHVKDGAHAKANQRLVDIRGLGRALVSAERSGLNFLQLLSGTATTAARYAEVLAGTRTRVLDTRKTIPGLRYAQKYAVRVGGGVNHRIGLFDAILIKENHIAVAGSIALAIQNARKIAPNVLLEIEVENLAEFDQALAAKPDRIMLDEFSPEDTRDAVRRANGQVSLEISGGVNFENLADIAKTGVDFVSVGALTKHIRAIDLSMRVKLI